MADDPQQVGQDEIEQLLAQMQSGKSPAAQTPTGSEAPQQAAAPKAVSQGEIEELLKSSGPSSAQTQAPAEAGASTDPPGPAPAVSTPAASAAGGRSPPVPASGGSRTLAQAEVDALLSQSRAAARREAADVSQPHLSTSAAASPAGFSAERGGSLPPTSSSTETRAAGSASISESDLEQLLAHAQQALASLDQPSAPPAGLAPFTLKDLSSSPPAGEAATLDLLQDVELDLRIEFGRTHLSLEDVLRLRKGSVVALDKLAGDPVDIFVNDRLIARGEVLVLNDNFCVRVAELVAGIPTG